MGCFKQCAIGIVGGSMLLRNMDMKQPTKIIQQEHILFQNKRANLKLGDLLFLYADYYKKCQRV
jgi:hypothetical protein